MYDFFVLQGEIDAREDNFTRIRQKGEVITSEQLSILKPVITLYPTYDVDQSYRQSNILDIALWLGQYTGYCPVVQLTTTSTWSSGQTQTPHL